MKLAEGELKAAIGVRLDANLAYPYYSVLPANLQYPHVLLDAMFSIEGDESGKPRTSQTIEVRFGVWHKFTGSQKTVEEIINNILEVITIHNSPNGYSPLSLTGFTVNNQTYTGSQTWANPDNTIQHKSVSIKFEITED